MRKTYNFFTRCCLYDAPLLRKKYELVAAAICNTGQDHRRQSEKNQLLSLNILTVMSS